MKPPPQNKKKVVISEYERFTGGGTRNADLFDDTHSIKSSKTADFTIYYNLAYENVVAIGKLLADKTAAIRIAFWAEFLWKAHLQNRNKSGYVASMSDGLIIGQLIEKVEALRNYHSHIWHDNSVLEFSENLKRFVETKYREAESELFKRRPESVTDYENLLQKTKYKDVAPLFSTGDDRKHPKYFITREGRIFFLSFFLTTGQMNQLLRQQTGYKRTDVPQFKLKRQLCTFYCHRDGASINDVTRQALLNDDTDTATRQRILKARTAYKLVTYLADYPEYWGDPVQMPLTDEQNKAITKAEDLLQFIREKDLLSDLYFFLIERNAIALAERSDNVEGDEEKYLQRTIAFTYVVKPDFVFHIRFDDLYRLVLFQLLPGDGAHALGRFCSQLLKLAENRESLYRILTKPLQSRSAKDRAYLLNKENHDLRGGRMLTEKALIFFEAMEKGKQENSNMTALLANYLRSAFTAWLPITYATGNMEAESVPEPIKVYEHDFISGERRKVRAGNHFLFYTAKFLTDFAGDEWYWGAESFDRISAGEISPTGTLRTYKTASELLADPDSKLIVHNGHVYLGLLKNPDAAELHERFYQFSLGINAMRYLACYIQRNEKDYPSKIRSFLEALAADIDQVKHSGGFNESDAHQLLESKYIHAYLKHPKSEDTDLARKLQLRWQQIKNGWIELLAQRPQLDRSEKNSIILNAYRLFDWERNKFLRVNEYNQMSIYHYSLYLKPKIKARPASFLYVLDVAAKLKNRQPPVPAEIRGLLSQANGLDELMQLVFENRIRYFETLFGTGIPLERTVLIDLCRKFGISVPAEFLPDKESIQELQNKQRRTFDVLPYSIHPMLVLKYFFPDVYQPQTPVKTGKVVNMDQAVKRQATPLFAALRENKQLSGVLNRHYYDISAASVLFTDDKKKESRNLVGLMNTTYTEDILLWWMTQRYLQHNEFTSVIGQVIKKEQALSLDKLYETSIKLALKRGSEKDPFVKGKLLDHVAYPVYASIAFHQLDDILFMTEIGRLRKAAVHLINRMTKEKSYWQSDILTGELPARDWSAIDLKENPVPLILLLNELELVRRTGQKFAEYLLNFERIVLEKKLLQDHGGYKDLFQDWLKKEIKNSVQFQQNPDYRLHCNFQKILDMQEQVSAADREILNVYRNIAFHNDLPISESGSFSWLTRPGSTIRRLLAIAENLDVKKDKTVYSPGGKLHIKKNK